MWFINRLSLQCPGVSVYGYRFEPKTSNFPLKYRTRSSFLQLNRLHFSIKKSSSAPPLLLFCYKGNHRVYPHPSIGHISVMNAFCGTVNLMRGTYFRPIFFQCVDLVIFQACASCIGGPFSVQICVSVWLGIIQAFN